MQSGHIAAAARAVEGAAEGAMVELLRSNDPVLLSWAQAVLKEARIMAVVMDRHMSVLEGSIGALPRRLMVADDDAVRARRLLTDAGVELGPG